MGQRAIRLSIWWCSTERRTAKLWWSRCPFHLLWSTSSHNHIHHTTVAECIGYRTVSTAITTSRSGTAYTTTTNATTTTSAPTDRQTEATTSHNSNSTDASLCYATWRICLRTTTSPTTTAINTDTLCTYSNRNHRTLCATIRKCWRGFVGLTEIRIPHSRRTSTHNTYTHATVSAHWYSTAI